MIWLWSDVVTEAGGFSPQTSSPRRSAETTEPRCSSNDASSLMADLGERAGAFTHLTRDRGGQFIESFNTHRPYRGRGRGNRPPDHHETVVISLDAAIRGRQRLGGI
jgi:hypothetical protein